MHYTIYLLAHIRSSRIDRAEPKLGVQAEPAQAEGLTNLDLDQGKPQCIQPILLVF
jgi:hypothetical protein